MEKPIVIAYDSKTGNVEWIAKQLGYPVKPVTDFEGELEEPVFLVTHTFGRGSVPKHTRLFLDKYADKTIGVCVSGDNRWGSLFALAGDKIRLEYEIPLVRKFDVRGYPSDIQAVKTWIQEWLNNESLATNEMEEILCQTK